MHVGLLITWQGVAASLVERPHCARLAALQMDEMWGPIVLAPIAETVQGGKPAPPRRGVMAALSQVSCRN